MGLLGVPERCGEEAELFGIRVLHVVQLLDLLLEVLLLVHLLLLLLGLDLDFLLEFLDILCNQLQTAVVLGIIGRHIVVHVIAVGVIHQHQIVLAILVVQFGIRRLSARLEDLDHDTICLLI